MASVSAVSDQARTAEQMYNARAAEYNDSWHSQFAADMVKWASIQPSNKVLDLACGTGLVSLPAAAIISTGPSNTRGHILSIDIADDMLSIARASAIDQELTDIITFVKHDITQLDSCSSNLLYPESFDTIISASCIPLLSDPKATISHWTTYLKPGGHLVIDVITPESQIPGLLFEQSVKACGSSVPWGRSWIKDMHSVTDLFDAAGLIVEKSFAASGYREGKGAYSVDDGENVVENFFKGSFSIALRVKGEKFKEKVKEEFLRRWTEQAKLGIVDEPESFYIVVGRKPEPVNNDRRD